MNNQKIYNTKIILTKPYVFEIKDEFIDINNLSKNELIVTLKYLSICKADIKYYSGKRPKEVLNKKLPLILIHEAVGQIVYSSNNNFKKYDNVCIVPIISNQNDLNYTNYDYNETKFMSSNIDGCLQKYIKINKYQVLKISEIKPEFATLEMGSIVIQAFSKLINYNINLNDKRIVVFGTGSLSYWVCLLLREIYDCNITVVGKSKNKLNSFNFIDNTILFDKCKDIKFDIAFECVGKDINSIYEKMITILKPNSNIINLGVSEYNLSFNIRKIMEKGISIITSHRSHYYDFLKLMFLIEKSKFLQTNLSNIVSKLFKYKTINDIKNAFEEKNQFKNIIEL